MDVGRFGMRPSQQGDSISLAGDKQQLGRSTLRPPETLDAHLVAPLEMPQQARMADARRISSELTHGQVIFRLE